MYLYPCKFILWYLSFLSLIFTQTRTFHLEKCSGYQNPCEHHYWFCHKNHFLFSTSLPVSFHWCVSRQCNLPPGDICSPTVEHKNSCSLIVNHVFHDSGKYCVNVGVMNDVSGTNTSLMVLIPGKLYIYTRCHTRFPLSWKTSTFGPKCSFVWILQVVLIFSWNALVYLTTNYETHTSVKLSIKHHSRTLVTELC